MLALWVDEKVYFVVPRTCPVGVRALVTGVDVDEDARVPVEVRRALAVAASAVAGEGDGLTCESASVKGREVEGHMGRRPGGLAGG